MKGSQKVRSLLVLLLLIIGSLNEASAVSASLPTIPYFIDKILGQPNFKETMVNQIVANRAFHVGGVHIDSQNRIYVVDSGNNRILGFQNYQGPNQNADIVIGQPSLVEAGTANTDNTQYLSPSASTLAFQPYPALISTQESPRFLQLATDSRDNLYVPDIDNNRILKFTDPFNTDQAADEVWGQPDFTSRQAHCGQPGFPLDNQSFCTEAGSSLNGRDDQIFGTAVFIDAGDNLWVADTGNHRVLRFPNLDGVISKTADLVLGQPDFTSRNYAVCWDSAEINRSKMWKPLAILVQPVSGEVYVLDGQEPGKTNRILVFTPPFASGMPASREFGRAQFQSDQPENPVNWLLTDDCAGNFDSVWVHLTTGLNLGRGLALNKVGSGDIWVNDADNNRMLLYDSVGSMVDVIGQTNFDARNCDGPGTGYLQPDNTRGPLCQNYGEIGVDSLGKLYTGKTYFYRDVSRFPLPLQRNADGLVIADGWLLHSGILGEGWNQFSGKTFQNGYGISLSTETTPAQLFVSDGQRILVWNNFQAAVGYQPADYVVGQDTLDTNFNNNGGIFSAVPSLNAQAIGNGYLWVIADDRIFVFALPITGSGKNYPTAKILYSGQYEVGNVYWGDDRTKVSFSAVGIAYDFQNNSLWVADGQNYRVLHISDPLGQATVDMAIGQPDKTSISPNAGQASPNAQGFASPWAVNTDRLGNLYVIDSKYEGGGNNRVLRFNAIDTRPQPETIFPLPSASGVYAKKNFNTGDFDDWWGPGTPQSPSWVGFDSQNQMIMLVDSYGNNQFERVFFYPAAHASEATPQPTRILPLGLGQGAFAFFHPADNRLIIQDLTWYRLLFLTLPTLQPNHNPVIRTRFLPVGLRGRNYQAVVRGYDQDADDNLEMEITGLPEGLEQGWCSQQLDPGRKSINCNLVGQPRQAGKYQVQVTLKDNHDGEARRNLRLFVLK